jgi:hypothetical protein
LSARKVRTFPGDKPKLSRLFRRVPFPGNLLPFKVKAVTPQESLGDYTELPEPGHAN